MDEYIKEKYFNLDETDFLLTHYQIEYQEMLKKKYDFTNIPKYKVKDIIYPNVWDYIEDKEEKIRILKEAIDNKIMIKETETLGKYLKSLYR